MIRDYTTEIGLPSRRKTVPRSVAMAILSGIAVAVTFGVFGVLEHAKLHHEPAATVKTARQ